MQLLHERPKASDQPSADTRVLIREARRLRRRRWATGTALLLVAGAGIGIGVGTSGPRPPVAGPRTNAAAENTALAPNVKMLNLTDSDNYGDIALVGGRILLYGPAVQEQDPTTSARCSSAVVNPTTLALSHLTTSSCANPALEGQDVLPVVTVKQKAPFGNGSVGVATVTVRIAHVVPHSPGYEVGPVVMSFPQESDGWPSFTYGDGNLWLFDALAKGGSQLLRISETTGAVDQRIAMPDMARPIIAVNADGFWMAPAANSLGNAREDAVYHLTPGASEATRALTLANGEYVRWMVASGPSLWLAPGPGGTTVWDITGATATLVRRVKLASSLGGVVAIQGSGSAMVGDASGLWTAVASPSGTQQQVLRLAPSTGQVSSVANLKPDYASPSQLIDGAGTEAITYQGAMYLLDPPAPIGPDYLGEGFSALYRITATSVRNQVP